MGAGLPAITGSFGGVKATYNGAFTATSIQSKTVHASYEGEKEWRQVTFNAGNSSNIYGKANTVQSPALSLIPQSKI